MEAAGYLITEGLMEEWRVHLLEQEKSACTIEKYLRDIRKLFSFLPWVNAEEKEISKALMIAWKEKLKSRYAVRSVNSMLVAANCFLSFMGWYELRVKTMNCQRETYCEADRELTKSEYLRLVKAAEGNRRLQLILETICATGIRVSELQYFTVEAVRRGRVTITLKNKTRNILVPGSLKKLLLNYCRERKITNGAVFCTKSGKPLNRSNIWSDMKKLCRRAKVDPKKVFPHNLRKLFARTFYGIEKDIAKLADLLGHSSIETTRIYIVSTGREHLRKIERLGLVV